MKRFAILLAVIPCLFLTGCGLIPEEESYPAAPLVHEYEKAEYNLYECTRGDIVLSKHITCNYVPVRTESLSFPISGIRFEDMLADVGDTVAKGQVLATLESGNTDETIAANERSLLSLRTRLQYLDQDHEIELAMFEITGRDLDEEDYAKALDSLNHSYDVNRQSLLDSIHFAELRLESNRAKAEQRRLVSPIDGVITFARSVDSSYISTAKETVYIVADSTMSLFRASTEYWSCFHPGDQYQISAYGSTYSATVTDAASLGLEASTPAEGQKGMVYFVLDEPTFELEDNDRGTVVLVLDRRENVLQIPTEAVTRINGQTVVYYQDADGFKSYKEVVIGLETDKMTEIISGLEEGDLVIAS